MRHPFDLNPSELNPDGEGPQSFPPNLEFEEVLSPAQAESVGGGLSFTTLAVGEEGGSSWDLPKTRPPVYKPIAPPVPPIYTTLALGEEGGDELIIMDPPEVTTLAWEKKEKRT